MDCWIGITQENGRWVVRLAGRLSAAHVPELLGACAKGTPVDVDLTDLVSADEAGIDALRRIRAAGATLVGVPMYLQMKLDSASGAPIRTPPPKRWGHKPDK